MMAGALTPTTAAALARVAASVPPARPSYDRDYGHPTDHPLDPRNDDDDIAPAIAEEMSRTPQRVADWISDVAGPAALPDWPVPFDALLHWNGAQTFEGLMTTLIGGTEDQAIQAMRLLREQFGAWAVERANG